MSAAARGGNVRLLRYALTWSAVFLAAIMLAASVVPFFSGNSSGWGGPMHIDWFIVLVAAITIPWLGGQPGLL
jgi:hypothetical protein